MITSKYLPVITVVLIGFCLVACGFIVYAANAFDTVKETEYQKRLFGDEVISLDIEVNEEDWRNLLDNAQSKEWISGDLVINGERFNSVGIRTKGNSSLSQGQRSQEGRYSLQFKFNKFVKGQTYYGLDAFCINNMMGDATYMKDYLSYDIMNYIGVETPLTNYADVTVNGEDYGFCIALERYDEAFIDRVYGTSAGELYSVKIGMGMRGDFEGDWQDVENAFPGRRQGNGNMEGRQPAAGGNADGRQLAADGNANGRLLTAGGNADNRQPANDGNADGRQPAGGLPDFAQDRGMGGGGIGGFGAGRGGGSLVYTSDDPEDYSAIFNNSVFGTATDADKQRVIEAIKNLNAGTDLEKYFDVDEILRYFAAHTIVVNLDSYTSNMAQNYYIYERDGNITILPWDYGLAFGGFQSGNASSVVNYPIDTPVSGVSMEDRPLLNKLLEVDEYRERYHNYLRRIVEGYFESGLYEKTIRDLDVKINEYVKTDVSAFFTHEQYEAALPQLIELGRLRAESVKGQLDGTIPSTTSDQNADNASLIDASGVNLSTLGSMMGGGGMGQGGRQDRQGGGQLGGQGNDQRNGGFGFPGGDMFDMELMQQVTQILADAGGELTEEVKAALIELGLTEAQIEMFANMQNRMPGGNRGQGGIPGMNRQEQAGQNSASGDNADNRNNVDNNDNTDNDDNNDNQDNQNNQDNQDNNDNQEIVPFGNFNSPQGTASDRNNQGGVTPQTGANAGNIATITVLLILLIAATVFIAKPKKSAL